MADVKYRVPYEFVVRGVDINTGQTFVNVTHYQSGLQATPVLLYGDPIPLAALGSLNGALIVAWQAFFDQISNHYRAKEYRLREVTGWATSAAGKRLTYGDQDIFLAPDDADNSGQLAGETQPDFVALSVQKKTSMAGREFRGGMRLGPVREIDVNNGRIINTYLTSINSLLSTFRSTAFANGGAGGEGSMAMVILSRKRVFAGPAVIIASAGLTADVIQLVCVQNTGSQTSRKPKSTDIITPT